MTIEDGGDSMPKYTIDPRDKAMVDSGFSGGRKLYGDAFNAWPIYRPIQRLCPVEHYENYLCRTSPQSKDYIMSISDPEAVAAFDRLVDEFNADVERIKQQNDEATKDRFVQRAKELIYKKS